MTIPWAVRATRRVTTMTDMMKTSISFLVRTETMTRGGTVPVTALIPTDVGFAVPVTALRAFSVTTGPQVPQWRMVVAKNLAAAGG
eukprot:4169236-Heterocapsa_arctica.AAC.1